MFPSIYGFWSGNTLEQFQNQYWSYVIQPMPYFPVILKNSENLETELKSNKKLVNISQDDLLNAGYENNKKLWDPEEDQKLLELIEEKQIPWKEIANHMADRTQKMCYSRYRRLKSEIKCHWKKEQDIILRALVEKEGLQWKKFSIYFPNRSWRHIRDRYMNYLREQIKKDSWKLEEDLKIIELINKFGKKWKQIQDILGNRTQNQIKNRYYGRLKALHKKKSTSKVNEVIQS